MTLKVRIWVAGATLVAVVGFVCLSAPSFAASGKDLKSAVKAIAEAFKNDDKDAAKKLATATVKNKDLVEEIADVMHMFRNVKDDGKGGLGIEKSLKKPKLADAQELGNLVAAMGELSLAHGWTTPSGKKTKKAWNEYTEQMQAAGLELAKAKSEKDVKTAATRINNACVGCHAIFKE